MEKLFVDELAAVSPSPAQEQANARRRALQNARQHKCRAQKRAARKGTPAPVVTPSAEGVTLFDATSEATPMPLALELLLCALRELSRTEVEVSRSKLVREMERQAKARGVLLMNAARFLDEAIERGDVPKLNDADWVKVPREVLNIRFGGNES